MVLAYFLWQLNARFKKALGGNHKQSLESNLTDYFKKIRELEAKADLTEEKLKQITAQLNLAAQKISIVRFNPFGDTGGDQSFSLAVLDSAKSGYVLTCIHGRDNTRTYIKPIDHGASKYTLSKEEKQAIEQAVRRGPQVKGEARYG